MTSRTAARLAWGICAVALAGVVAVTPLRIANGGTFSLNEVSQMLAFA